MRHIHALPFVLPMILSMSAALSLLTPSLASGATIGESRESRAITINSRVSSKLIALNQPVRIDFTTMPRQIENIDIASTVANSLAVGLGANWRVLGKPVVSEHDKTKTVTVAVTLLPRKTGKIMLPQIPITWLQGDQYAEFGEVEVSERILVGGDTADLPKECNGVAGFAWGAKLAELKTTQIADNLIDYQADKVVAHPKQGLDLVFRGGELAEAVIAAPGITIDQARESFFSRWGLPQVEDASGITWVLGWTRITASSAGADQGVRLALVREDIQTRLNKAQVKDNVFDVLEGPGSTGTAAKPAPAAVPAESDEQARTRLRKEADEFKRGHPDAAQGATTTPAPAPNAQPTGAKPAP